MKIIASYPDGRRLRLPSMAAFLVVVAAAASLLTFHLYPYDNVISRWGLVRSVTEDGTLEIDRFACYTSDKAFYGRHFYSDKAILLSALCVPVQSLALATGISSEGARATNSLDPGRFICERLLVTGSFVVLLLAVRRMCALEGIDGRMALAAAGLGSIMLPYSSILYAHVPAACCIFLSYLFQKQGRFLLADVFGAAASAFEYPVLLLYVILLAYRGRKFLLSRRAFVSALVLVAAFVPQMIHNWIAFGGPLRSGYSLEASDAFEGLRTGFFGFNLPSPARAFFLLFPAERGFLFYMPWAIPALAGLFLRRFGGGLKRDPAGVLFVAFLALFSALWTRTEGWAFGPRYLIPVIPFLAVGLARFAASGPRAIWASAVLILPAMLQAFLGLLGEMHLPVHPFERPVPLPQVNISLQMLLDGHHSLWLPGWAGMFVVCASALILWALLLRKSRFCPAAFLVFACMVVAVALSPRNWGGKIDYYRGILAEHRLEYLLAAKYYAAAARDPQAPAEVASMESEMLLLDRLANDSIPPGD
jgi:hypothetical protein